MVGACATIGIDGVTVGDDGTTVVGVCVTVGDVCAAVVADADTLAIELVINV